MGPNTLTLFAVVIVAVLIFLANAIRILREYERGVIFRLGRLIAVKGPGLIILIPFIDKMVKVSLRTVVMDVPPQDIITKDNVSLKVNAVVYFRVMFPEKAIVEVENFLFATSQLSQTTLRSVLGQSELDDLLSEREKIGNLIELSVEHESKKWGLEVTSIKLQDIDMPEELKKMMSRQASAEREKRATITKAEGDKLAAFNLAEAARTMHESPGAMQLRTLQTIDGLGPTASNTVVLAVPVELMELVNRFGKK